jgi:ADP-heptose:LPS heptosyltransferase
LNRVGRAAVIANDALGNFVVATPLLQLLRQQLNPAEIVYFGGARTEELETASDLIDRRVPIHGRPIADSMAALSAEAGTFDWVANLERSPLAQVAAACLCRPGGAIHGPRLSPLGRVQASPSALSEDPNWMAEDLTERYPALKSGFIGEIFCRVAGFQGPIPTYRVPTAAPSRKLPDVLLSVCATGDTKLWPAEAWLRVAETIASRGQSLGLIGAAPKVQQAHWAGDAAEAALLETDLVEDLRGQFTLPEVVGAIARCRLLVTLDNGILHLAAATQTPTVGLFRHGIHRLWAPPAPNICVLEPGLGRAVAQIEPEAVLEACRLSLAESVPA